MKAVTTKDIYMPHKAVVTDVITESPTIKTFVLKTKEDFAFRTGQFIELTVPGAGEAPFTPSSDPNVKGTIDVTIMKAGKITGGLHGMAPGSEVGLRGPYGKGYPLEKFKDKEIVIVGGGVGLAPLRSLLFALFAEIGHYKKVVLRYGARTSRDIIYKEAIPTLGKISKKIDILTTVDVGDPSWKGNVGLVTTVLGDLPVEIPRAVAIVCGPPIMMIFVTLKLLVVGVSPAQIYLSMENMSCGLGKCGHCRLGKYYTCKDGPVFTYEELQDMPDIWD